MAYGSTLGELYASVGTGRLRLKGFSLWWSAWAIGVALCAAVLRTAVEVGTFVAINVRREQAVDIRRWLESLGQRATLSSGFPAWLVFRIYSG